MDSSLALAKSIPIAHSGRRALTGMTAVNLEVSCIDTGAETITPHGTAAPFACDSPQILHCVTGYAAMYAAVSLPIHEDVD